MVCDATIRRIINRRQEQSATANRNLASAEARLRHVRDWGGLLTSRLQGEPTGKESCTPM